MNISIEMEAASDKIQHPCFKTVKENSPETNRRKLYQPVIEELRKTIQLIT